MLQNRKIKKEYLDFCVVSFVAKFKYRDTSDNSKYLSNTQLLPKGNNNFEIGILYLVQPLAPKFISASLFSTILNN